MSGAHVREARMTTSHPIITSNILNSVTLRPSQTPTVVRSVMDFYVHDTSIDLTTAIWRLPLHNNNNSGENHPTLHVGSQDCAATANTTVVYDAILNVGYGIDAPLSRPLRYLRLDLLDNEDTTLLPESFLKSCWNFLDDSFAAGCKHVLIHCNAGVSRSATVAISYMMLIQSRLHKTPSVDTCLTELRQTRPQVRPNAGFMTRLGDLELVFRARTFLTTLPQKSQSPPPPPAIPISAMISITFQQTWARLRFLAYALRPFAGPMAFLTLLWSRSRRLAIALFLFYLTAFRDYVHVAAMFKRVGIALPGLFYSNKSSSIIQHMLIPALRPVLSSFKAPWWSYGDVSTVSFFAAGYSGPPNLHIIREISMDNDVEIDWLQPSMCESTTPPTDLVLMLAGVGGDSNSPYVRCVAHRLASKHGVQVAIILPRGLGVSTPVSRLQDVFDPADDERMVDAIKRLSVLYRKIVLVGFSLGGVATCRVLARNDIPMNVMGGVSVSGAFQVRFATSSRYEDVFQEGLIVPSLVDDFVTKYGHLVLESLHGDMSRYVKFLHSRTYRELHENLYMAAGIKTDTFDEFRVKLESDPSQIKRPLLLLTALDDPLHHVEEIGCASLFDGSIHQHSTEILLCVTECGGHVAWPESGEVGYRYVGEVIEKFYHVIGG